MNLKELGYNDYFENFRNEQDLDSFETGRVVAEHRDRLVVMTEAGEMDCEITGNLRFTAENKEDLPAVGDWVTVIPSDDGKGLIHSIYPRQSVIKRKAAGNVSDVQLIATNVDVALIVQAVDRDFNLNRLERYLVISNNSNIKPIILLNKIDLISPEERKQLLSEITDRVGDITIVEVSSELNGGYDQLSQHIKPGLTYCLLGSSGAGKSTITNALSDTEAMKTSTISSSVGKGRHTTTHRELVVLPSRALIIDNPGMREVGIADGESGLESTFESIGELAGDCHYSDCTHTNESDCAVLDALENGELDHDTYGNFLKLQRERAHYESTATEKKRKDKRLGKMIKSHQDLRKKNKF
ncbi:MAG: ribosome small subunit-dependent GTPase A [Cyclobacteriaceae bacterium]